MKTLLVILILSTACTAEVGEPIDTSADGLISCKQYAERARARQELCIAADDPCSSLSPAEAYNQALRDCNAINHSHK